MVAQRGRPISGVETIHGPFVPFAMNRLPGMRGIIGNRQKVMVRSDSTAFAIGQSIVCWKAKFTRLGIVAKIIIKGAILLTGNQHMIDRVNIAPNYGGTWFPGSKHTCLVRTT